MSATSGIPVASSLLESFSAASRPGSGLRFLKVSIVNEQLVLDSQETVGGSFDQDLDRLQTLLDDNAPAYVLTRTDDSEWLAIYYVPDTAKVRDKMLYASTRNTLLRSLGGGGASFQHTLFATSKADLTPSAYAAHLAHQAAPHPMTAQEKEMADIREAERAAGSDIYRGAGVRTNHVGSGVGLTWSPETEDAMQFLVSPGAGESPRIVILTIDAKETLNVHASEEIQGAALGASLPQDEPCYAAVSLPDSTLPTLIFLYSCPSTSKLKPRMVYSSAAGTTMTAAKLLIAEGAKWHPRRVETSDPGEVNEEWLRSETSAGTASSEGGPSAGGASRSVGGSTVGGFAKPRGPSRRK